VRGEQRRWHQVQAACKGPSPRARGADLLTCRFISG